MKIRKILLALLVTIAFSGCGLTVKQRGLLSDYSSAASDVGARSATEFSAMQEMVVQANKYNIVIEGMETYAPLQELQGDLSDSNIFPRIKAAKALESYGRLLSQLVNKSEKEKLREAAKEAFAGAKEFDSDLISDDVAEGVQKAVMAVGGLFLERKKAEAVREVVLGYKLVIDELCQALVVDFSDDTGGVRQNAELVCEEAQMLAAEALRDKNSSIADRDVAMNAENFSTASLSHIDAQGDSIVQLASRIRELNNSLAAAFENQVPDSFEALKEEVEGLVDLTKELTE
jgi:hypothetical protein